MTFVDSAGYVRVHIPGHPTANAQGYVLEHRLVAERALGRRLPRRSVVHHVNGDRSDNRPSNLVLCEDRAYHTFLHLRQRALEACGHPDWLHCRYCGEHDDRANLYVYPGRNEGYHRACGATNARERYDPHLRRMRRERRQPPRPQ